MMAIFPRAPRKLEIALALFAVAVTVAGLWISATQPVQRRSVEALEGAAAMGARMAPVDGRPSDLAAAQGLCVGSLARHLSRLEGEAPEKSRAYSVTGMQLRFGPAHAWKGFSAAEVTLTLKGSQQAIGQALAAATVWLPSFFFETVRLAPDGAGTRLEARGRVVCLAS